MGFSLSRRAGAASVAAAPTSTPAPAAASVVSALRFILQRELSPLRTKFVLQTAILKVFSIFYKRMARRRSVAGDVRSSCCLELYIDGSKL